MTSLTPGEELSKCCLKFLSSNCRSCEASWTTTARLTASTIAANELRCITLVTQYVLICSLCKTQCHVYLFCSWRCSVV
jgi:hypothetical protein